MKEGGGKRERGKERRKEREGEREGIKGGDKGGRDCLQFTNLPPQQGLPYMLPRKSCQWESGLQQHTIQRGN